MGNKQIRLDRGNLDSAQESRNGALSPTWTSQALPNSHSVPANLARSSSQGKLWSPFFKFGSKRKLKKSTENLKSIASPEKPTYSDSLFLPEFPVDTDVSEQNFKVLNLIAKGAYGNVLRVKCTVDHKIYAMKILEKTQIIVENAIQQSKDEVTILDDFGHHPFIVSCHFYWQYQKNLFLVMDYISNGELLDWWMDVGCFPEDFVRLYIAEVAMVLDFLNRNGVIYRDLKMENLLIDNDYHLKVIDFGLAKWLRMGGRTRTVCGTLHYMAPEVLAVTPYGHSADWWTIGILMYAMIAGEFPVGRSTHHVEMAKKVAETDFSLPKKYSPEAQSLVARLLDRDPVKRLHNYHALKQHAFFKNFDFDKVYIKAYNPLDLLAEGTPLPGEKIRQLEVNDDEAFPEEHFPKTPTLEKILSFQTDASDTTKTVNNVKASEQNRNENTARKRLFYNENLEAQSEDTAGVQKNSIKDSLQPQQKSSSDGVEGADRAEEVADTSAIQEPVQKRVQKPPSLNLSPPAENRNEKHVLSPSEKIVKAQRKSSESLPSTKYDRLSPQDVHRDNYKQNCDNVSQESPRHDDLSNYYYQKHRNKRHSSRSHKDDDIMTDDGVEPITPSLIRQATEKLMASRSGQPAPLTPSKFNHMTPYPNSPAKHNHYDVNEKFTPDARRLSKAEYADVRHEYRASIALYDSDDSKPLSKSVPTTPKANRHFISPIDDLDTLLMRPENYTAFLELEKARLNYEDFETDLDSIPFGYDYKEQEGYGLVKDFRDSNSSTPVNMPNDINYSHLGHANSSHEHLRHSESLELHGEQSSGQYYNVSSISNSIKNSSSASSSDFQVDKVQNENESWERRKKQNVANRASEPSASTENESGLRVKETLIIDTPDAFVVDMGSDHSSGVLETETPRALIVEVKSNKGNPSQQTFHDTGQSLSSSKQKTPFKGGKSVSQSPETSFHKEDTYQWQTNSPVAHSLSNSSRSLNQSNSSRSSLHGSNKYLSEEYDSTKETLPLKNTGSFSNLSSSTSNSTSKSSAQVSPRGQSSPGLDPFSIFQNQRSMSLDPRSPDVKAPPSSTEFYQSSLSKNNISPRSNSIEDNRVINQFPKETSSRSPVFQQPQTRAQIDQSMQDLSVSANSNLVNNDMLERTTHNSSKGVYSPQTPVGTRYKYDKHGKPKLDRDIHSSSSSSYPKILPETAQTSSLPFNPAKTPTTPKSRKQLREERVLKSTPNKFMSPLPGEQLGPRVSTAALQFTRGEGDAKRSSAGNSNEATADNYVNASLDVQDRMNHMGSYNKTPKISYPISQPGISQPGISQPGISQPGISQPGISQPGISQPGMTDLASGEKDGGSSSKQDQGGNTSNVSETVVYSSSRTSDNYAALTAPKGYKQSPGKRAMHNVNKPRARSSWQVLVKEIENDFFDSDDSSSVSREQEQNSDDSRTIPVETLPKTPTNCSVPVTPMSREVPVDKKDFPTIPSEPSTPTTGRVVPLKMSTPPSTQRSNPPSSLTFGSPGNSNQRYTSPRRIVGQSRGSPKTPTSPDTPTARERLFPTAPKEKVGTPPQMKMNGQPSRSPGNHVSPRTPQEPRRVGDHGLLTPTSNMSSNSPELSEENLRQRQLHRMTTPRVRESWQKVIDEGLYFPQVREYSSSGVHANTHSRSSGAHTVSSSQNRRTHSPVESSNARMQSVKNWYKRILVSSGMSPNNVRIVRDMLDKSDDLAVRTSKDDGGSTSPSSLSPRSHPSYRHAMEQGGLGPNEISYKTQAQGRSLVDQSKKRESPVERPTVSHARRFLSEIAEKDEEDDMTWRGSMLLSEEISF